MQLYVPGVFTSVSYTGFFVGGTHSNVSSFLARHLTLSAQVHTFGTGKLNAGGVGNLARDWTQL